MEGDILQVDGATPMSRFVLRHSFQLGPILFIVLLTAAPAWAQAHSAEDGIETNDGAESSGYSENVVDDSQEIEEIATSIARDLLRERQLALAISEADRLRDARDLIETALSEERFHDSVLDGTLRILELPVDGSVPSRMEARRLVEQASGYVEARPGLTTEALELSAARRIASSPVEFTALVDDVESVLRDRVPVPVEDESPLESFWSNHPDYHDQVAYCGPGASIDVGWSSNPGNCLNAACHQHDLCYDELIGHLGQTPLYFSAPYRCCDLTLRESGRRCATTRRCGFKCHAVRGAVAALIATLGNVGDPPVACP
jgi:hypothetical protein